MAKYFLIFCLFLLIAVPCGILGCCSLAEAKYTGLININLRKFFRRNKKLEKKEPKKLKEKSKKENKIEKYYNEFKL